MMQKQGKVSVLSFLFVLVAIAAPIAARAQCPDVGSGPQAEQYAANKIQLRYYANGPGGGDDRPALFKSPVMVTLAPPFDPVTTHSVRVRFLLNGSQANVMWDATIPPNATWVHMNNRWTYVDPNAPFGVNKARIIDYGGMLLITFFRGYNQSIANAPVNIATDNVTAEVEIFDSSNPTAGICYGGSTSACTGMGNTQTCKVH